MGKHDQLGHQLHISKKDKFVQPKPPTNINQGTKAPQAPRPGHSSYNLFK